MALPRKNNKRKPDDADREDTAPKRRRRAPRDHSSHSSHPDSTPAPRRITRGMAARTPNFALNPGLPYTSRIQEQLPRQRPPPPAPSATPADWARQYLHLEPAPDPAGGWYQRGPPLRAAHNAAMLQLAYNDFRPFDADSPQVRRVPPTWRNTLDGPRSHPITRIRYGNLTKPMLGRHGEVWVNTTAQTATTPHQIGNSQFRATQDAQPSWTALATSDLPDGHPLLVRAPPPDEQDDAPDPESDEDA